MEEKKEAVAVRLFDDRSSCHFKKVLVYKMILGPVGLLGIQIWDYAKRSKLVLVKLCIKLFA